MAKKSELKANFICEDCGQQPKGRMEGNWQVYDTKCPECGGRIKIDFNISKVSLESRQAGKKRGMIV